MPYRTSARPAEEDDRPRTPVLGLVVLLGFVVVCLVGAPSSFAPEPVPLRDPVGGVELVLPGLVDPADWANPTSFRELVMDAGSCPEDLRGVIVCRDPLR